MNWIIENQLGRRNLHPDQASYLRGKRYNGEKITQGTRNQHLEKDQNDPFQPTADRLATEYKVSAPTIKRDGQYAAAVDKLAEAGIGSWWTGRFSGRDCGIARCWYRGGGG